MNTVYEGGCLCGAIRYKTSFEPQRVVVCHCTFCQRLTGTAFLVEPIFKKGEVEFSGEQARTFNHRSDESDKQITLNFCGTCGTTLLMEFERFPEIVGVCGGTFDDPNWFEQSPENCKHIFTRSAQEGVMLPPDMKTFEDHAMQLDGTPNEPTVFAQAVMARKRA